jgi:hypothetical protein
MSEPGFGGVNGFIGNTKRSSIVEVSLLLNDNFPCNLKKPPNPGSDNSDKKPVSHFRCGYHALFFFTKPFVAVLCYKIINSISKSSWNNS